MSTNKRDNILAAALALFAERGYDGTTVPTIADYAKVGAGTIYRYFENKEVLVNSLFQESIQKLADVLETNQPPPATATRDRFKHVFNRLSQFAQEDKGTLEFIDSHSDASFLNETSKKMFQKFLDYFRAVLDEGKAEGSIHPISSDLLIAIVYGAMMKLFKLTRNGTLQQDPQLLAEVEQCCWNAIRKHDE